MTEEHVEKLLSEKPISTAAAARYFGDLRGGKAVAPSTLVRWMREGVSLRDGRRVFLEFIEIGRKLCTTHAAIVRFLSAQQPEVGASPVGRSPAERTRAAERARDELLAEEAI